MVDLKEEQKYERLRKLAQELHIPIPEAFWTLEVFDKDGKLIQKHRQRSHSWTRNAYNLLFGQMASKAFADVTFGAGLLSIKETGGAVYYDVDKITDICGGGTTGLDPDTPSSSYNGYLTIAGDDTKGILVGSGTNAESFEDYALQTPIADGTGAGQLSHVESEVHSVSYADTTLQDEQVRYFNNNSGGNVDVNEVGLIAYGMVGAVSARWLQSRDKLGATVTVPDTGQLKVTYTIELAYAA